MKAESRGIMGGRRLIRVAMVLALVALLPPAARAEAPAWQAAEAEGDAALNGGNYQRAIDAYDRGIKEADADRTNPQVATRAALGHMLTGKGNALLKLKRNGEAIAAYTQAAAIDPHPATAYFNLCATQYNAGNVQAALAACEKAIKYDPRRADAYFIKGSLLVGASKTGKDNKVIAPPGTVAALRKYLELAPNGPHAADVKAMLSFIGSPVGK